ncbi:hypothetical protein [Paraliobacillus sp. JSM ZJ581]|uniref:hypothetical protein n=1 Tax=Paraliobacillus sp. JSM ZJ581 TaxID=3342118 RepID=UPI0035A8D345
MALIYRNFRGDTYYLHERLTKKGNKTFHFSKRLDASTSAGEIPSGYEIYEEPNGKVYVRKQTKPIIKQEEINIIREGMKKHCTVDDYKLDSKKNVIYVYTIEDSFQDLPIPLSLGSKYKHYETKLRFVLVDKADRFFEVERFCYLGGIDDWITLDCSEDLKELVREYVQHLGKESFYELM